MATSLEGSDMTGPELQRTTHIVDVVRIHIRDMRRFSGAFL